MTPKEPLQRFIDFVNSSKIDQVSTLVFYGYEIDELQKLLKEHKRLQEFKATFDNYELSKKQDFIVYENWQECEKELEELKSWRDELNETIQDLISKTKHWEEKENKTQLFPDVVGKPKPEPKNKVKVGD